MVVATGAGATASRTSSMEPDTFVSAGEGVELAQTQTKENRDTRQEGRQDTRGDRQDTRDDCRDAEGAAGKDKRDCKQEGRQGGSGDGG